MKNWPEPEKPAWVANQLEKHKIPHAKQVFYDRTSKFFPCGIEITEYVEGMGALGSIERKEISYKQFCTDVTNVLYKVHQIEIEGYGHISNGKGTHEALNKILFETIDRNLDGLKEHLEDVESLARNTKEAIEDKLGPYHKRFKPTLTHYDVSPDNCRYRENGELILIDWDNSVLFPWPMELAIATYWSHEPEIMEQAFLEKYGEKDFTKEELTGIVEAFHIHQRINLIHFYLIHKGDRERFEKVLKKLKSDVDY